MVPVEDRALCILSRAVAATTLGTSPPGRRLRGDSVSTCGIRLLPSGRGARVWRPRGCRRWHSQLHEGARPRSASSGRVSSTRTVERALALLSEVCARRGGHPHRVRPAHRPAGQHGAAPAAHAGVGRVRQPRRRRELPGRPHDDPARRRCHRAPRARRGSPRPPCDRIVRRDRRVGLPVHPRASTRRPSTSRWSRAPTRCGTPAGSVVPSPMRRPRGGPGAQRRRSRRRVRRRARPRRARRDRDRRARPLRPAASPRRVSVIGPTYRIDEKTMHELRTDRGRRGARSLSGLLGAPQPNRPGQETAP